MNLKTVEMKKIEWILLIAATLIFTTSMFAQGCEVDDPSDTLAPAKIKIFGYLQPEYQYTQGDPGESTFTFRRARIGVRGRVLDDFTYYFMLEASPFIGGQTPGVYLMDAFVTWDRFDWAKISMGSYKQPFGLEVYATGCHNLVTIDRAIVSDQLVVPQRDYGIMLLGGDTTTRFSYAVAVMNGSGLLVKDENNKKDFVGRATYQLFDWMHLGASFRYGYPVPNDNDSDRTTWGGEIRLDFNNLHIQGEYIEDEGAYNRAADAGCGSEPLELGERRAGAYGMIWYDTKWNLQPVFKYEYFDQDLDVKDIPNAYSERMTIGLNYFFSKNVRVQLNYQANIETVINEDNDRFLAQIQVRF